MSEAPLSRDEQRRVWEAVDRGADTSNVVAAVMEYVALYDERAIELIPPAGLLDAIDVMRASLRRLAARSETGEGWA